jgi:hypothetical protein
MDEPILTPDNLLSSEPSEHPAGRLPTRAERVHALMGKYAWIPFSSDDHVREKQEELEREKRKQEER